MSVNITTAKYLHRGLIILSLDERFPLAGATAEAEFVVGTKSLEPTTTPSRGAGPVSNHRVPVKRMAETDKFHDSLSPSFARNFRLRYIAIRPFSYPVVQLLHW